ncbi:hypothetical protein ACLMJK_005369 [Lecanora helva]
MERNTLLPDARSSHLYLTHPTAEEFQHIYSLSYLAWGDSLSLSEYLEESMYLTTVPLAKDGGMSIWMLTDKTKAQGRRPILCSCETFRKRAFIVDADGQLNEGIVHGVASVFCNPDYRGRGYAARLMRELAALLPKWQVESAKCIGSVLYSDIGKEYYAKLGWHPVPSNRHIELEPMHITKPPQVSDICEEELEQYCKDDEAMIRRSLTRSWKGRARMMLLPDVEHMLWNHRKAEFACEKLFGRYPRVKGAVVGEKGDRIWIIWTHRYYGNPNQACSDNTLYILRFVMENLNPNKEQHQTQLENVHAILKAAQSEAAEWKLHCVKCWDPANLLQDLLSQARIEHRQVEREEESIASLLWFGNEICEGNSLEWTKFRFPTVRKCQQILFCQHLRRATYEEEIASIKFEAIVYQLYLLKNVMKYEVTAAALSDADRIADIHMAAFGANVLLLAQFPTLAIRDQLRKCIAQKAADDIRDPYVAVLIARDQHQIISFAKWSLPVLEAQSYVEAPWKWPEGTNYSVLNEWTQKVEDAQSKTLRDSPSYRTDPDHERRGAGSALIKWGLDKCVEDNLPAYLESTLTAGPLYERLGFTLVENISIILGGSTLYHEACYLYKPSKLSLNVETP